CPVTATKNGVPVPGASWGHVGGGIPRMRCAYPGYGEACPGYAAARDGFSDVARIRSQTASGESLPRDGNEEWRAGSGACFVVACGRRYPRMRCAYPGYGEACPGYAAARAGPSDVARIRSQTASGESLPRDGNEEWRAGSGARFVGACRRRYPPPDALRLSGLRRGVSRGRARRAPRRSPDKVADRIRGKLAP